MAARIGAGLALIGAALLLGLWIVRGGTPVFDPAIVRALAPARAWPDVWRAATWLGDGGPRVILWIGLCILLLFKEQLRSALLLAVVVPVEVVANSGLKLAFARVRPDLLPHLDGVTTFSFPSGHAAHSAALYLLAALLWPGKGRRIALGIALALVTSIGLSRIILGVHWPSDVLAGWAVGGGCALIGSAFAARPIPRRPVT